MLLLNRMLLLLIPLRQFLRTCKTSIPNGYTVYLKEHIFYLHDGDDPTTFSEAISCYHASNWLNAMHDELSSLFRNYVYDFIEFPIGCK